MHEHAGKLTLRLLAERLHMVEVFATTLAAVANLHISIAWLRTGGSDSHTQNTFVGCHKLQTIADIAVEGIFIIHGLVGRDDDDIGIWTFPQDVVAGPCHTGSRVAVHGLTKEMVFGNRGQLAHGDGHKLIGGGDENMVVGNGAQHTVVGLLQLRPASAEKVDKLFGIFLTTAGPKSFTTATSQYHAIVLIVCRHSVYRFKS